MKSDVQQIKKVNGIYGINNHDLTRHGSNPKKRNPLRRTKSQYTSIARRSGIPSYSLGPDDERELMKLKYNIDYLNNEEGETTGFRLKYHSGDRSYFKLIFRDISELLGFTEPDEKSELESLINTNSGVSNFTKNGYEITHKVESFHETLDVKVRSDNNYQERGNLNKSIKELGDYIKFNYL